MTRTMKLSLTSKNIIPLSQSNHSVSTCFRTLIFLKNNLDSLSLLTNRFFNTLDLLVLIQITVKLMDNTVEAPPELLQKSSKIFNFSSLIKRLAYTYFKIRQFPNSYKTTSRSQNDHYHNGQNSYHRTNMFLSTENFSLKATTINISDHMIALIVTTLTPAEKWLIPNLWRPW